jgi:hypothetical protein
MNSGQPKEEENAFLSNGIGLFKTEAAKKFVRKIQGAFQRRKNLNAHLFENGSEWHIFWFTFDDINSGAKGMNPHWTEGDHVHYTSYLWGHKKEEAWEDLASGKYSISGEHIKYKNNDYPESFQ